MITGNHSPETDKALIEELAKILWLLDKRGYIQTDVDEDYSDMVNLRTAAQRAVQRARERMGVSLVNK